MTGHTGTLWTVIYHGGKFQDVDVFKGNVFVAFFQAILDDISLYIVHTVDICR